TRLLPSIPVVEFVFFFSSRRRHTRSKRDWSSDVCSSDLSRSFSLANSVKSDAIKADYQNGVLTLSIPKREEAKPKQIKVNVGTQTLGTQAAGTPARAMAAAAGPGAR